MIINNEGLLINNGLIIIQADWPKFFNIGAISTGKIPGDLKYDQRSCAVKLENSLELKPYNENENNDDEIAISRYVDSKDNESLMMLLEEKPSIKKGIINNGKIINANTGQITLDNSHELYNSEKGSIINYNIFRISKDSVVRNDGEISSFTKIRNKDRITGNTLKSIEKYSKKDIRSLIDKEIQKYRS